jgi:hypothetical protein
LHSAFSLDFLYSFGEEVGDTLLQPSNDGTANVQLSTPFPYFDEVESDLFVSEVLTACWKYYPQEIVFKHPVQIHNNGILSFRKALLNSTAEPFPIGVTTIAPFWADVDTRPPLGTETPPAGVAREDIGKVFYREEFDRELLERAGGEIRDSFIGLQTFTPTSLFIATWINVGYYDHHIDKV